MELLEAIAKRQSIRKYRDKAVDDEAVQLLLQAARRAPSGNNQQPWNFIVVRSAKRMATIAKVSHNQTWMTGASVMIACVADLRARTKGVPGDPIDEPTPGPDVKKIIRDTAIAIEHVVLQAQHMGLATCWVAHFTQKEIRPVLGIPEDQYVVAVIPVGYPNETKPLKGRRDLDDMVFYEKWGDRQQEGETL